MRFSRPILNTSARTNIYIITLLFVHIPFLYSLPPPTTTATTTTPTSTLRLGVILPYKGRLPWALPKTRPAIDYAVETVHNRSDLLVGFTLEVNTGDSQCSETFGPLAAIDMYVRRVAHVFIGPACDYAVAPIARFSPHWNIPVITGGALVQAFKTKKQYRLLTRMSSSYAKLGEFIVDLFLHFNWTTAGMIYNNNKGTRSHLGKSECHFTMEAVYLALQPAYRARNPSKDFWYKDFDDNGESGRYNFSSLVEEAGLNSRIILLCASPDTAREIMIKAASLNFDNGEYAFFNIDLFGSKARLERPWYRANDTEERNDLARSMYKAVMTVTLRRSSSERYRKFSDEVKRRAKEQNGGEDVYSGDEEV